MAILKPETATQRFEPARSTLFVDRWMNHFIKVGGALVIAAVMGIFIFILWQILPLFKQAQVDPIKTISVPEREYLALGVDEWGVYPFLLDKQGSFHFFDLNGERAAETVSPSFSEPKKFSSIRYRPSTQSVVYGTEDGFFAQAHLEYVSQFENNQKRVTQKIETTPFFPLIETGKPVEMVDFVDGREFKIAAGVVRDGSAKKVHAVLLKQKRSLIGKGKTEVVARFDLSSEIKEEPRFLVLNGQADALLVATEKTLYYFFRENDKIELKQTLQPFSDQPDAKIASLDFLLGNVSVVLTSSTGENRIYSLYIPNGGTTRLFGETKKFPSLPSGATFFSASLRNKSFLMGEGSLASLRYATTEKIRWQEELGFEVKYAALNGKYDRMLFLDSKQQLHLFSLEDPHPETSFAALFGKLWYEGYSQPEYAWQSTGGTDDFEPKLSLVPLMIGTFKGTLYALLFAVPIALLAAIYTSQFVSPEYRRVIKPAMEIMASLPSVVLGFLAALWLAPLLETRVPSILLIVILLPAVALGFGRWWSRQPVAVRSKVKPGTEFLVFIPILLMVAFTAWVLGPQLEKVFFGGDFRAWWPAVTGASFEQRNSLVVGFMMGFAVIPILFTIAEDAFSNVPMALRSASLACGASRWQTAIRVVLPTASAGIFSAIMIGLGRAVGETMIVVMATGNTPIMDLNIFSGMRTLSANIAVELPEAPHHGTLYRALFLGAMVLFLMTFFVNTLAELLRQHLREKFKTA